MPVVSVCIPRDAKYGRRDAHPTRGTPSRSRANLRAYVISAFTTVPSMSVSLKSRPA